MPIDVRLSADAERDLFEIWRYVEDNDSPEKADALLDKLEDACRSLQLSPNKGHVPKELRRIDISQFEEIHYKPYRILFERAERSILIHAILDGRRDMETLLRQRLLR